MDQQSVTDISFIAFSNFTQLPSIWCSIDVVTAVVLYYDSLVHAYARFLLFLALLLLLLLLFNFTLRCRQRLPFALFFASLRYYCFVMNDDCSQECLFIEF